jgi:hypothetical protein
MGERSAASRRSVRGAVAGAGARNRAVSSWAWSGPRPRTRARTTRGRARLAVLSPGRDAVPRPSSAGRLASFPVSSGRIAVSSTVARGLAVAALADAIRGCERCRRAADTACERKGGEVGWNVRAGPASVKHRPLRASALLFDMPANLLELFITVGPLRLRIPVFAKRRRAAAEVMPDRIRLDLDRRSLAVGRIPWPHSHPADDQQRISSLHRAGHVVGKSTPAGDGDEVVVLVMFCVTVTCNPVTAHDLAGLRREPGACLVGCCLRASGFADGSRQRPATRNDRPLPQRRAPTVHRSGSSHRGRCRPLACQVAGAYAPVPPK